MTTRDGARTLITEGRSVLGIEFGSTRIKACLVGENPSDVLATGSHEWQNHLVDGVWTYPLDEVWAGVQSAYSALVDDSREQYGVTPTRIAAIGVSAMMHGYLPFDDNGELLVPFRTWRNTTTAPASAALTELFGVGIPLRWSIAHLHQAVLNRESHVPQVRYLTTLAGYVHWRLTGEKVLGVGDASGMFPMNSAGTDYDADLLARYDAVAADSELDRPLRDLLPAILAAGQQAGHLTAEGARLLDTTGVLCAGAVCCPPEGDAGTGMVATNAVAPRSGNVSAGTSIFAMVVLERPLQRAHPELDIVATPGGHPVAMVHCNNGTSELAEWVSVLRRWAELTGSPIGSDDAYRLLLIEALEGAADAGGLLAYNQVAGEPIAGLSEGRPLIVRMPDSNLTLANVMRAHLYGVFAVLSLGMRVLRDEGVAVDRMQAHGGLFRTAGVAQALLAAALGAPVGVVDSASEGGAWGIAVLASFALAGGCDLADYLERTVFARVESHVVAPDPVDAAGFASYLPRYESGLEIQRRAIDALPHSEGS
ncbi:MAG: FGGY-family carbohydrate kinase [Microcella sp.]|uniref:xylulokinase n=1 Tax=Microcella sp. TaxID=1913979 RepID=UPI0033160575